MPEEHVLKEVCEEKHKNSDKSMLELKTSVTEWRKEMKTGLKDIYNRQTWFYLVAIGSLVGTLSAVVFK